MIPRWSGLYCILDGAVVGHVVRDSFGRGFERLDSFVDAIVGKRLTYARLIAKVAEVSA